ncbi:hypothetical protein NHQ30_007103, partial [Ciborinia camelliae]
IYFDHSDKSFSDYYTMANPIKIKKVSFSSTATAVEFYKYTPPTDISNSCVNSTMPTKFLNRFAPTNYRRMKRRMFFQRLGILVYWKKVIPSRHEIWTSRTIAYELQGIVRCQHQISKIGQRIKDTLDAQEALSQDQKGDTSNDELLDLRHSLAEVRAEASAWETCALRKSDYGDRPENAGRFIDLLKIFPCSLFVEV